MTMCKEIRAIMEVVRAVEMVIDSCNCILSVFSLCMFDYFIEDIGVSFGTKTTFFMAVLRDGDGTWKKTVVVHLKYFTFMDAAAVDDDRIYMLVFVRHNVWFD